MTVTEQLDKVTKATNTHKYLHDIFIHLPVFAGIVTISK